MHVLTDGTFALAHVGDIMSHPAYDSRREVQGPLPVSAQAYTAGDTKDLPFDTAAAAVVSKVKITAA